MSDSFVSGFKQARFEKLQQDLHSLGYECWIEEPWRKIIAVDGCSPDLAKILGSEKLTFSYDFLALDGIQIDPPGADGKTLWKITYPKVKNGNMVCVGPNSFSFCIYQYGWGVKFINEDGEKKFNLINRHGGSLYNSSKHVSQSSQYDVDMIETIVDNIVKSHRLYEKYALNKSYGTL
ncbi:hypothetical protein phiOC_p365 [Ochrobactrum phage vB_OspM_OC]|nr:hypothetical protein phiOC_p365 [Ochrobactrum phage vB_OspM_OC]